MRSESAGRDVEAIEAVFAHGTVVVEVVKEEVCGGELARSG